ncbi:outer membrane protein assembly factor BamA [Rubrivirga sp.]|uniref:outer membrane protein assembly factor BamA n=1 Tax=Rubrivirga sp. TaxID=1885344 RepID=UPI003C71B860
MAQAPAAPSQALQRYQILSVTVEGASDEGGQALVRSISELRPGTDVQLPWDPQFAEAVRRLYARGGYSDVEIEATEVAGDGVFLTIKVVEEPRLALFEIEGLKSSERDDVRPQIPLLRGRAVREADVERGRIAIRELLRESGYRSPTIEVARAVGDDGRVTVRYDVDKGDRLTVTDLRFFGNEAFSDNSLGRQFKNTRERRWWRFWKRETFDDSGFQEDLNSLVRFYNDRGYFGARVVRDSVYTTTSEDGNEDLIVEVEIDEGPLYHVRDIVFEGNTVYTDDQLQFALGVNGGDVYDRSRLDQSLGLVYSEDKSDISSLYRDQGYLTFRIDQEVIEAPGDSLDLFFEITEGEVYEFGEVRIAGNTRTKEHVIRRELRTVPGQTYSQVAIERSVRELATLNYFDPASFGAGPSISVDDNSRTVDLVYNLSEISSDQLELSGGYGGGNVGLILTARVTFNNFSIQNLAQGFKGGMPTGDGQQLSLQVQTYGTQQQVYSLSFTEPWFRGRPTPVGFSLSYQNVDFSRFRSEAAQYGLASARVFYRQRLKWPDDFFSTGTNIGYKFYDVENLNSPVLPEGISQELTLSQSLTRNALDNPTFPQSGSSLGLTFTVAPPIGDFIQYHKTDFQTAFYTPVVGRLTASVRTQFGYIGSLTGDDVQFQRYLIGGTPLEASGRSGAGRGFGRDLVYLRGYPLQAIGPRLNGEPVGGRILNKYEAELGILLLQTPQLSFAPYLFADAANTYDSFDDYDPARLFRSAGAGARLFLPILGLVDLTMGYQIDSFTPFPGDNLGEAEPQWRFQFSLGGR